MRPALEVKTGNLVQEAWVHAAIWRIPHRNVVLAWMAAILGVWGCALWMAGGGVLGTGQDAPAVQALSAWDGQHYTRIALEGYANHGPEAREFVFFPLLPALARLLGGRSHVELTGVLLAQTCLLGSLLLLAWMAHGTRPAPLRLQPGFWLLVSPVAFFLSVFYSESLFLFLSIAAVVACRAGRVPLAVLAAFLVGLTRHTAVCLPALFVVDAFVRWRKHEDWRGPVLCAAAPLAALALYFGFVGYRLGSPLAYVHTQSQWWEAKTTVPFYELLRSTGGYIIDLLHGHLRDADQLLRLLSSLAVLGLTIWGRRKLDLSLLAYLVASLVFIHSLRPNRSTARYELVMFPLFLLLPKTFLARPRIAPLAAALLVVVQIKFFLDHISWRWVS
jgi:hypothetical protein